MAGQSKDTQKKSTKQRILEAALHCFNEHGIETTTIDMIRERSGASVGSLYHHFGSKESIGAALFLDAMRDYHTGLRRLLAAAESTEAGVKAITLSYIDWVAANPEKALFVLYSRRYLAKSGSTGELERETEAYLTVIIGWFKQHLAAGRLKRLPLECYTSLLLGPAHDYARLWLSGRGKTHIVEFREIFAEAAWNAVKPE